MERSAVKPVAFFFAHLLSILCLTVNQYLPQSIHLSTSKHIFEEPKAYLSGCERYMNEDAKGHQLECERYMNEDAIRHQWECGRLFLSFFEFFFQSLNHVFQLRYSSRSVVRMLLVVG